MKMESERLDRGAHLFRCTQRIFKLGPDQQADELLAAEAGEEVDPASTATQGHRHFAQYGVAAAMSTGIVDRLESVDVPNQDRNRVAEAAPACEFLGETLVE